MTARINSISCDGAEFSCSPSVGYKDNGGTESFTFKATSPGTGDSANFGLWTALLLLSAAGFAALIPERKRHTGKSK